MLGAARRLGDAGGDEVHRIEARHVLQLQEVDGMRLALAEHGDQHIGAGHLVAAGALHVDRRALHHALERGGGLRLGGAVGGQAGQVLVEELGQVGAQLVQVDAAGAQHGGGVAVVGECEQQVLERRIFVASVAGERERTVECLL